MNSLMQANSIRLPDWFVPSDMDVVCGWYVVMKAVDRIEMMLTLSRLWALFVETTGK